jgi:hypothetical protein
MKNLSQIDKVYDKLSAQGNVNQKLNYCRSLIHRTENFVTNKGPEISEYSRKKSFALIIAAEKEIESLSQNS